MITFLLFIIALPILIPLTIALLLGLIGLAYNISSALFGLFEHIITTHQANMSRKADKGSFTENWLIFTFILIFFFFIAMINSFLN
jgi:hypothetical protein